MTIRGLLWLCYRATDNGIMWLLSKLAVRTATYCRYGREENALQHLAVGGVVVPATRKVRRRVRRDQRWPQRRLGVQHGAQRVHPVGVAAVAGEVDAAP